MSFANLATLIHGTERTPLCPLCGHALGECVCEASTKDAVATTRSIVRVGRETKGRAGKGVTVISGLVMDDNALQALATDLKKRCGSGGTVRDGCIEIQGEHRDTLIAELSRRGIQSKRAGG